MKILSHKILPDRGLEEMIVEDDHGRRAHFQASIFSGPDPDTFFAQQLAEFEAQEKKLHAHIDARFDRETRERKPDTPNLTPDVQP
jgi:hypothetical protein